MTGLYHKGLIFVGTTFELRHDRFVDEAGDPMDWSGWASDSVAVADSTGAVVATGAITFPAAGSAVLRIEIAQTALITGGEDLTFQGRIASAFDTFPLFYGDLRSVAEVVAP